MLNGLAAKKRKQRIDDRTTIIIFQSRLLVGDVSMLFNMSPSLSVPLSLDSPLFLFCCLSFWLLLATNLSSRHCFLMLVSIEGLIRSGIWPDCLWE